MRGYYSDEEIEKALEKAEHKGLGEFMTKHPRGKKSAISNDSIRHSEQRSGELEETNEEIKHSYNFFDGLMFGTPSYQHKFTDTFSETSSNYRTQYGETQAEIEDEEECNPCEQVREIVQGIREGKYRLKTGVLQQEVAQQTEHEVGFRKPEHWTTKKRFRRDREPTETFKYQKQYWDGGNMQALRMKK